MIKVPHCVPLCNAGDKAPWWKHEALCPRRDWKPSPPEPKQQIPIPVAALDGETRHER